MGATKLLPIRLLAILAVLGMAGAAHAQTRYFWDGNDTDANANGGNGTWNTSSTNWDTAPFGGSSTAWINGSSSLAIFGGSAGTVTLGTDITVGGLTFNTTGYVLTGATNSKTLTFATGTNNINLIMSTATTAATITGAVAGDGDLVFSSHPLSNATLNFNGTSTGGWTGTTTINANVTINLAANSQALLSTSAITLNGGNITLTNTATGSENTINRVSNSAAIASYGSSSFLIANTATASRDYTETIGSITHYNGQLVIGFS